MLRNTIYSSPSDPLGIQHVKLPGVPQYITHSTVLSAADTSCLYIGQATPELIVPNPSIKMLTKQSFLYLVVIFM